MLPSTPAAALPLGIRKGKKRLQALFSECFGYPAPEEGDRKVQQEGTDLGSGRQDALKLHLELAGRCAEGKARGWKFEQSGSGLLAGFRGNLVDLFP